MKRLSETTSKSKVSLASLVLRVISAVLCSHVEKEKKTKTQQRECMLQDFYREKTHLYRQIVQSNLKCLIQSDINKLLFYPETCCVVGCVCAGRCVWCYI